MATYRDRPSIPSRRLAKRPGYLRGQELRPLTQGQLVRILGSQGAARLRGIATVLLRERPGSDRLTPTPRVVVYARLFSVSRSFILPASLRPDDIGSYEWSFET
jgi:hypothetical protein